MKQLFWESKTWQELNKEELHEILRIRSKVFVVEQNCVYQDIDKKDLKAIHLLGKKNKKISILVKAKKVSILRII